MQKFRYFECVATEWLFCPPRIYALIAMLRDDNENVGMAKMLAHRKQVAEESANKNDCRYRNRRVSEKTCGITLPICHSQSVERHVKFVAEASA